MNKPKRFLDLFAGAGGLSEGFIKAGFIPVAHVESNKAACFTLRTRAVRHWLYQQGEYGRYLDYLRGNTSRKDLYGYVEGEDDSVLKSVIHEEISDESLERIFQRIDQLLQGEQIDLIVGGPPCQAYSVAGRARDKNRMLGDKRNYLYVYYARFLERYQPKYFLFENVKGLLSAKDEDGQLYLESMKKLFYASGYSAKEHLLDARDYDVPQNRKRIILIGKKAESFDFFTNIQFEKSIPEFTIHDILGDLPFLKAGQGDVKNVYSERQPSQHLSYLNIWSEDEAGISRSEFPITWHQARPHTEQDLEIYRRAVDQWIREQSRLAYDSLPEHLKTHKNRHAFVDRFKVVAGNLPFSHTVVAHIARDGHYYIHPDPNQNRSLTPREAARLQTFPDDYFFEGENKKPSRAAAFRQIGNAVPVLLAYKLAQRLESIWNTQ